MYTTYIWNMLHIHCRKVVFAVLFLTGFGRIASAQPYTQLNLPNSDQRWLHYGFSIGIHSNAFKLNYSDYFVNNLDSVQSMMPKNTFGFSLGFIVDFKLHEQFNLRILPRVSFSEFHTDINIISDSATVYTNEDIIEATYVDFPIMLKYKSERHQNFRMYMVAGIVPSIEASGKKRKEKSESLFQIAGGNLSFEVGFGVDMYYPLYKFSPEIRYSRGLINVLKDDPLGNSKGIEKLTTHSISLYFQFSD